MKNFHKGGGGLLVFILLFRNLKAQNGIFWVRIGCFDVYDNSVCGWSTIPHQYIRKLAWTTSPPPAFLKRGGGHLESKKIIADFFMDRLPFWFVGGLKQAKVLNWN